MDTFIQQILNGLVLGSMYALIALGYTMVYGVLNLINFAHGDVLMIGAMVGLTILKILGSAFPGLPGGGIDPAWIAGKKRIGVTAGASAPEVLVQAVIDRLKELGAASVRALEGVEEHVTFPLPRGLTGERSGDPAAAA